MTDRVRCAECVWPVAYECDKLFREWVDIEFINQAIDNLPAYELKAVNGKVKTIKHAPGTDYAIDYARARRALDTEELQGRLSDELGCKLSPDEVRFSLYEAAAARRAEDPEHNDSLINNISDIIESSRQRLKDMKE